MFENLVHSYYWLYAISIWSTLVWVYRTKRAWQSN